MDYTYNNRNLLTGITTSGGPTYSFDASAAGDIDGLGRLKEADETISYPGQANRSHTSSYEYNMQSGLVDANITNINGSMWTAGYTYKKDGNIEEKTVNSEDTEYEYDTNEGGSVFDSDIMTKAGDDELDWDDNGRLAETPQFRFEYNYDGKLRRVYDANDDLVVWLKYDPMGNRVWKQSIADGNGTSRNYIVDISGSLPVILCEVDPCETADSSLKKAYIYANAQILAQYDCNGVNGDTNEVIVNNKFFYVHDRLGNVRLVINDAADVNNAYAYSPFGGMLPTECNEQIYNPFKFTGQWYDSEVGQYYLRARMYDPQIMRFTSIDPVKGNFERPLALHLYLYCINDPLNKVDPNGEFFDILFGEYWGAKMDAAALGLGQRALAFAGKIYAQAFAKACMVDYAIYKFMNEGVIDTSFFRGPEYSKWKVEGVWKQGWHFHLPWGPGMGQKHLPQEFTDWWLNFRGIYWD